MSINQQLVPMDHPTFELELQGKQSVRVHFKISPRIILCGFEGRGKCAVALGPLVFALDQPPDNVNLDSVVLDLGCGDFHDRLVVDYENGWPVIRVPAYQIPTLAAFKATYKRIGNVELIPVLFAGLKANPGLSESLDGSDLELYNRENYPINLFPEYRVLLPFFWCPE
jgi:hypothetical protein